MQRLLAEGMKLVVDCHDNASLKAAAGSKWYVPKEAYGHLAAALRLLLVGAEDERLLTLASMRFLDTLILPFKMGAGHLP